MTVLEAIQKSTGFLARKNIESPRLQAELLLAHLLSMPRMKLYLNFERKLTTGEIDAYREFIRRRSQFEPLQHITGTSSFCGFEFICSRHALIPRPETELLAEAAWQFLNSLAIPAPTALDFGTGTGCLAVTLALKCPQARLSALDLSAEALELARQNAAEHQVNIEFYHGDGFRVLPSSCQFDLIVSNPPYIAADEIATLSPEVQADPRLALDGGVDGLDFYRLLASEAKHYLRPGGKMMLEFGDGQAAEVQKILENEKWIVEAVKEDYSQRARMIFASI